MFFVCVNKCGAFINQKKLNIHIKFLTNIDLPTLREICCGNPVDDWGRIRLCVCWFCIEPPDSTLLTMLGDATVCNIPKTIITKHFLHFIINNEIL